MYQYPPAQPAQAPGYPAPAPGYPSPAYGQPASYPPPASAPARGRGGGRSRSTKPARKQGPAREQTSSRSAPGPAEKLGFLAGYPDAVAAGQWFSLLVVLHAARARQQAAAALDRWAEQAGVEIAQSSTSASTGVSRGTTLTLVPSIPGVMVNPAQAEVQWFEDVQEVPFRARVEDNAAPASVAGQIDVLVGGLLIATIPVAMRIGAPGFTRTVSQADTFDRVFASYSRRDSSVVSACVGLYRALGVEVLVDQADLRSGDDWRQALHRLIAAADVFQLYWSSASAASTEVDNEWRFALAVAGKGPRFVRPLFWENPMPPPPAELSHLHFSRIDLASIGSLTAAPLFVGRTKRKWRWPWSRR
jgi:TIR domain-containing protein